MTTLALVLNYLKAKPLNTLLNILLMGIGIAIIVLLLLFNQQLEQKLTQNTKGIDLVVGAKGSPMQLILCNIFHIDYPTGNINLREAEKIARNRMVKLAIPLALGDSYQGYRIVGTDRQYAMLYNGTLDKGDWFSKPMQVVVGFHVAENNNLKLHDTLVSTHGLTVQGGSHDEEKFIVVGILKKSNTVLDNLILSSIESIWQVHEGHDEHVMLTKDDAKDEKSRLVPGVNVSDSTKEITSMLIKYRSPMGALQLPRMINSNSSMQAASPAMETARLFSMFGVGIELLRGFAYVLIFISALSIFIALYNSLAERKYDLAVMRTMGASRSKLLQTLLLEGILLTFAGCCLGLMLGHITLVVVITLFESVKKADISGFIWLQEEWIILLLSMLMGIVCSFIPAMQAYRMNISKVLAGN